MVKSLNVLILVLFVTLLSNAAFSLEIVYPADGSYVSKSNYLIISGGKDPFLDGMAIEINGIKSEVIDISGEQYRAAFGDMLVVQPLFDSGENEIIVEGYLGRERLDVARATVFFYDQHDQSPPAKFKREIFHFPEREAACTSCHNMTPSEQDLAASVPQNNPCGSCHVRMISQEHVHGPAGVFECTYCHEPDSRPNKYQARPGDAKLCMECHEDKIEEFRQPGFVHGPIEAGMCLVCHDPHASGQPSQLVMPAYDLCVGCHANVIKAPHVSRGSGGKPHPLNGVTNPAGRGEDLSCASCHDPHSGKSEAMFRWGLESRFQLCAKCHEK